MTTFKQLIADMFNRLQSGAREITEGKSGWGPDKLLVGHFIAFGDLWIALGTTTPPETLEMVLFATEAEAKSYINPLFRVYCSVGSTIEEIDMDGFRFCFHFTNFTVTHPTAVPHAIAMMIREAERTLPKAQE